MFKRALSLQEKNTDELLNIFSEFLLKEVPTEDRIDIYAALGMSMVAHSGDKRRSADLCTNHILRVSIFLLENFNYSKDVIVTGILHDIFEDHPQFLHFEYDSEFAWNEIGEMCGERSSEALRLLTNPVEVEEEEKKTGDIHNKYHEHLGDVFKNPLSFLIKFADFVDNIITVGISPSEKLRRECTPRYLPLLSKYKSSLNLISKEFKNINDFDSEFFEKINNLYLNP